MGNHPVTSELLLSFRPTLWHLSPALRPHRPSPPPPPPHRALPPSQHHGLHGRDEHRGHEAAAPPRGRPHPQLLLQLGRIAGQGDPRAQVQPVAPLGDAVQGGGGGRGEMEGEVQPSAMLCRGGGGEGGAAWSVFSSSLTPPPDLLT